MWYTIKKITDKMKNILLLGNYDLVNVNQTQFFKRLNDRFLLKLACADFLDGRYEYQVHSVIPIETNGDDMATLIKMWFEKKFDTLFGITAEDNESKRDFCRENKVDFREVRSFFYYAKEENPITQNKLIKHVDSYLITNLLNKGLR